MRARVLSGALARALVLAGLLAARATAQEPVGTVDVQVTVDADGVVRVEERYRITPAPPAFELRALTRPCAEIGEVRTERDGVDRALVAERDGPWILYHDPSSVSADTSLTTVRYDVRVAGADVDVPLLHLTTPIPQQDGEREGTVGVTFRFAEAAGRVSFPHMTRVGAGTWSARYVAIPSFVRIVRPALGGASDACGSRSIPAGGDGGLTWRFLLLVGIMAAWVPAYLWWAGRSAEDAT